MIKENDLTALAQNSKMYFQQIWFCNRIKTGRFVKSSNAKANLKLSYCVLWCFYKEDYKWSENLEVFEKKLKLEYINIANKKKNHRIWKTATWLSFLENVWYCANNFDTVDLFSTNRL